MKNGWFFLILLSLAACTEFMGERGNDERVTQSFTVDDFNRIHVSGAFDVTLTPSKSNDLILEVDENLIEFIDITVNEKKLIISTNRRLISRGGIKLEIPVKKLNWLESSGASTISSNGPINTNELILEMSGAGKLDLQLDVKFVSLELSGAAAVYLEGAAKRLEVDMSGAGSLEAEELEVEECSVDISGVGTARVNVTGSLEARVSGLGKVNYVGNPEHVKGDVSGIGSVDKANE